MPSFSARRVVLVLLGLVLLVVLGLAVPDWCGEWSRGSPVVGVVREGQGKLRVGAGVAPLSPPLPAVIAGYGLRRGTAESVERPLFARALVLEAGNLRVGIVNLDVLAIPRSLLEATRERVSDLGLDALWVTATHTHSSFGGYDDGLFAQVVGMGRASDAAKTAAVQGAREALLAALESLEAVTMFVGEAEAPELSLTRSGERADARVTRIDFRARSQGEADPAGRVVGRLVVLAAHPTLAGPLRTSLHPDYPGVLAMPQGESGEGATVVTLVLQGAGGNSAARLEPALPRGDEATVQYAAQVRRALAALSMSRRGDDVALRFARAEVSLPRPDLHRPVPRPWNRPAENLLCSQAPKKAELSLLSIGDVKLLALPFEPSFEAGRTLETLLPEGRVVSLVDGYLGYLEPAHVVREGSGESQRQYFGAELLERLREGASGLAKAQGPGRE